MFFDTPILSRHGGYRNGFVPQVSDREFWSIVLMGPRYIEDPIEVEFNLVTDGGDSFVDDATNQLVALN